MKNISIIKYISYIRAVTVHSYRHSFHAVLLEYSIYFPISGIFYSIGTFPPQ